MAALLGPVRNLQNLVWLSAQAAAGEARARVTLSDTADVLAGMSEPDTTARWGPHSAQVSVGEPPAGVLERLGAGHGRMAYHLPVRS